MNIITFYAFYKQVTALYAAQEYTQALELVEEEQAVFTENAADIAYWRLCFHSLLGKQTEALRIFHETLEQGNWCAPVMLEQDPDLADLRPLAEFQAMVEVCRQRLAQIKGSAQPELLVEEPAERVTALPVLLALHGNGENAHMAIEEWSGVTAQGWLLGLPTSSQIVGPNSFVWDKRAPGVSEVQTHLATLMRAYTIDPERVVLGGYSMGAGLAVWMAFHQSIKARGFVAFAPYLYAEELEALPAILETQKPGALRGSILVGEKDTHCLEVSRKIVEIMRAHDLPCELEIHPNTDHMYPPNFEEFLRKGLAFIEQV